MTETHEKETGEVSGEVSGSRKVIYAAILANLGIAVAKFIVAAITGSAAMLAEGIHSAVDTGNEFLLLVGERNSAKPPEFLGPAGRAVRLLAGRRALDLPRHHRAAPSGTAQGSDVELRRAGCFGLLRRL
jgi:hypothetical protein